MALLLSLFLSLAPAFAAPSFSGLWLGKGTLVMKPGTEKAHDRACSEIAINLHQGDGTITMSGDYICEEIQATYDESTFQVKDGALFFEGEKVGSLSDSAFDLNYTDPDDGSTFYLTLSLDPAGGTLGYREEWLEGGASQMLTTGALQHQ